MSWMFNGDAPPVGFYYQIHILGKNEPPFPPADGGFQEVSGISVTMETEDIMEGGENRFKHKVPGRTNYENLVLKRGLMVRSSELANWCEETFTDNLTSRIKPKTIMVSLLDASDGSGDPIVVWMFTNAYPIKWEISPLDAQKSELVIESITFTYNYFERIV